MKFIVYFEPMDIDAKSRGEVRGIINMANGFHFIISKILPVDENGFIIEQPKQVE